MNKIKNLMRELNDSVKVWAYAKKEDVGVDIISKTKEIVKKLKSEGWAVMGESGIYFKEFRDMGPSVGVLVGSDSMFVVSIKSGKIFKVGHDLIASLMSHKKLEGIKFSWE